MTTKKAKKFLEEEFGPLTLGAALRAHREVNSLTQQDVADMTGLTKSRISDIERNRKTMSGERAFELARDIGASEAVFVRLAFQGQLSGMDGLKKVRVIFDSPKTRSRMLAKRKKVPITNPKRDSRSRNERDSNPPSS